MPHILFLLEAATVLATFVLSMRRVCLCAWRVTHLPTTYNSKLLRYKYLTKQPLPNTWIAFVMVFNSQIINGF
ncbi:hypothetical protein DLR74_13675 [Vibrio paracholerae]|nr:hypothetical protein DLR74_13675 [Vibrio paracholerae]